LRSRRSLLPARGPAAPPRRLHSTASSTPRILNQLPRGTGFERPHCHPPARPVTSTRDAHRTGRILSSACLLEPLGRKEGEVMDAHLNTALLVLLLVLFALPLPPLRVRLRQARLLLQRINDRAKPTTSAACMVHSNAPQSAIMC
jgi:hypothetical protein